MACDRCGELERRLAAVEDIAALCSRTNAVWLGTDKEPAGIVYGDIGRRLRAAMAGGSEAPAAPAEPVPCWDCDDTGTVPAWRPGARGRVPCPSCGPHRCPNCGAHHPPGVACPENYTKCNRCGAAFRDTPIRRAHHLLNHGAISMEEFEAIAATEVGAAAPEADQ